MPDIVSRFVDRTSMCLYYDKIYTTHEKKPPLKVLVLLTDLKVEDLSEILSIRERTFRSYSANVTSLGQELYRVSLQRTIGLRQIKRDVLIDCGCQGVWIVLTDADSYFVAHVLETFVGRLYPLASKLYLNYSQMRSLLRIIRQSCNGKTPMTFFTIKRMKAKLFKEETSPKREETEILWGENVDEDIRDLLTEGYVVKVKRLDFELRDESDVVLLKAQISRKGLLKLKFGSFSSFFEKIVFNIIEYGLAQKKFYDKRERKLEKGTIHLHPLQINYPQKIRDEQLGRFAKKIIDSYSCSIIHGGNPYFVADLCDYEDGSSFGVTILGNSVTVTPITRATPSAVWKLLDEIQEIMGDGEIVDVKSR